MESQEIASHYNHLSLNMLTFSKLQASLRFISDEKRIDWDFLESQRQRKDGTCNANLGLQQFESIVKVNSYPILVRLLFLYYY